MKKYYVARLVRTIVCHINVRKNVFYDLTLLKQRYFFK